MASRWNIQVGTCLLRSPWEQSLRLLETRTGSSFVAVLSLAPILFPCQDQEQPLPILRVPSQAVPWRTLVFLF